MASSNPDKSVTWEELGLKKWLVKHIKSMGMEVPSEIQKQCIPVILAGKNCVGCAQTGSGKTASFALPIVQDIAEDPFGVHTLVITPTRELAAQLNEQIGALGKPAGIRVSLVIGGLDEVTQGLELTKGPHIVIATPGRLNSIFESSSNEINISSLKFVVLDEVDALLSPGDMFDHLNKLLSYVLTTCNHRGHKPQILAFSATISSLTSEVISLMDDSTEYVNVISENSSLSTVQSLSQHIILTAPISKDAFLIYLLKQKFSISGKAARQAIVFAQSCWQAHIVGILITRYGISCSILHSALPQMQRQISLQRFRSSTNRVLVCTDVASRGLDIPVVDFVFNYTVPMNSDDYIHRVGRTARAGRNGEAVTFIIPYELERWLSIQSVLGPEVKMNEICLEDNEDVMKYLKSTVMLRHDISSKLALDPTNDLNKRIERIKERRRSKRLKK